MSFIAPTWEDANQVRWTFRQGDNIALMIMYYAFEWVSGTDTSMSHVRALHYGFMDFVGQYVLHEDAALIKTDSRLAFGATSERIYEEEIFGGDSGDAAPPFQTLYVRQTHPSLLVRSGQKRLPFVAEGSATNGEVTISNEARNNIEALFGGISQIHDYEVYPDPEVPGDVASTWNIRPLIIGRKLVLSPTPTYILDDERVFPVTDAIVAKVSTQNSRKR